MLGVFMDIDDDDGAMTYSVPSDLYALEQDGMDCGDEGAVVLSYNTSDPAVCAGLARRAQACGSLFEVQAGAAQCGCHPQGTTCVPSANSNGTLYQLLDG